MDMLELSLSMELVCPGSNVLQACTWEAARPRPRSMIIVARFRFGEGLPEPAISHFFSMSDLFNSLLLGLLVLFRLMSQSIFFEIQIVCYSISVDFMTYYVEYPSFAILSFDLSRFLLFPDSILSKTLVGLTIARQIAVWILKVFNHHAQEAYEFIWFLNTLVESPMNSYGF